MCGLLLVPVLVGAQTSTPSYNPNSSTVKKNVLKIGSKGPEVVLWQGFLAKQKLMSSNLLTGNFGPVTKVATQNFQKLAGLTADGVVGSGTLFFLENIMYPGLVLKDAPKDTLAYLQDLSKQSKVAGVNKTKSSLKQVLTNLLSVTPLTQTVKTNNLVVAATKNITSTTLSPKISTQAIIPIGSTTQKSSLNTDTLKTFASSTGAKIQYSCTFTSQYTQICLPINTTNTSNANGNTAGLTQNLSQSTGQSTSYSSSPFGQTSQTQGTQGGFSSVFFGNQSNGTTSNSTSSQSGGATANSSAPLFWYCTDPSCNTLSATTTPWWQSYTLAQNPEMPNSCVPLSGYDIKLKLTAEDIFSVYAYKENSQGKVTEMVPVCKDMKASVYGVPSWKTIESCKKFKLSENQHLAVVVADDGKIAEGWIGRLEIVGNVYFSQDFSWQQIISNTTLPKNMTDFPTTQLIQEMNTGLWKPTSVIGPMGIDPWGIFTDDTSLDDASWMKVADQGLGKFSVFRLKNCGIATPASSVDLKVDDSETATVDYGSSVEISWNVSNVTSCTATSTPTNASWANAKSINGGTTTVNNLTQNTTFNINCTSEAGPITDSVQVTVKPTVDLKVNNLNSISVAHDSVVNLSWISSGTTSCVASEGTVEWQDSNNASGQISTTGTFPTAPLPADETFVFVITCTGVGGTVADSVSVEVGPDASVLLSANPTTLNSAGNVVLTWTPKFVNSCTALSTPTNGSWANTKSINGGSVTVNNLAVTTEFKITCMAAFNEQVEASTTVTVGTQQSAPIINSIEMTYADTLTTDGKIRADYIVEWSDAVYVTGAGSKYIGIKKTSGAQEKVIAQYQSGSGGNTLTFHAEYTTAQLASIDYPDDFAGIGTIHLDGTPAPKIMAADGVTPASLTIYGEFEIPAGSAPTVNFEINGSHSASVSYGYTAYLNWTSSGAQSCTALQTSAPSAPTIWSGTKPLTGALVELNNLQASTVYTLKLTCPNANGATDSDTITITVDSGVPGPSVLTDSASLITTPNPDEVWYYVDWSEDVVFTGSNLSDINLTISNSYGGATVPLFVPYIPGSNVSEFIFKTTVSGDINKYKGAGTINVSNGQIVSDQTGMQANLALPTNFNF